MKSQRVDKKEVLSRTDIPALYKELIPKFKETKSGQGIGLCSFHPDTHPSLSLNLKSGVFNCFSCGAKGNTIDLCMKVWGTDFKTTLYRLAKRAGLHEAKHETKKKIETVYGYMDAAGNLNFQCVKYKPKGFTQRRPDPNNPGKWIYNLRGVQLVPYNLPQVIKSTYSFICEGEKDCESLKALGLVASTNPMGAGKWKDKYNESFRDKKVFIIGDNDEAGKDHVQQVAKSLHGVAASVKVVELKGLPEKGDVTDWITERKRGDASAEGLQSCRDTFLKLVEAAPEYQPPASSQVVSEPAADDTTSDPSGGGRGSGHLLKMYEECKLYHDDSGTPYIHINGKLERLDVKNRWLSVGMSYHYYKATDKAPGREAISQAIGVLEGKAIHEGTQIELFNRVGGKGGVFFYDLGKGRTVAISAGKWEVVDNPPVFFHTFNHQHLQPEPLKGGDLWHFFKFCNLSEEDYLLVMIVIIASFIPQIAHPVICIIGSHGGGKSFLCKLLKTLGDPSASTVLSVPKKEEDMDLLLYRHHLVVLDNLSDLSGSLSDRISGVITGASAERRMLHTDTDIVLLRCNPVIVLNGIVPFIHRPDLLDRSITITLERITPEKRLTENELWQQFQEALPSILGGVFDTLSKAMEIYPTVKLKNSPRLCDFTHWGFAIAEALGGRGHEFMKAYAENANLQTEELVEGNTFFSAVMHRMENEGFLKGTFKEVLEALKETASPGLSDRTFPASPRSFRRHLERIKIPLLDLGIRYEIKGKSSKGRIVEFSKCDAQPLPDAETLPAGSGDLPF